MNTLIIGSEYEPINFGATGNAEIIQNVRMILSTPQYSVPLDREFGIDGTLIDKPLPIAKAKITAAIITAIQKYEPRVKIEKVIFEGIGDEGILKPKVKVVIIDDK